MGRIVGVGRKFPEFSVPAVVSLVPGEEFTTIDTGHLNDRWAVVFFWPMDFTFVCPTEIAEFNRIVDALAERGADLYGASTDTQYVHLAWRQSHPQLRDLRYPMLADHKKELSDALGILHPEEKVAMRATYIVDPEGNIRWLTINDLSVGRNVPEVIRVLDALQTDELTPCNWQPGEATLSV